jgi:prepilin peptidase CpaA
MSNATAAVAFFLLLLTAACIDFRSLRIPNRICLWVALTFVAWSVSSEGVDDLHRHVLCALGVLAFGWILFSVHVFGGGDAKLLAATALWIEPGAIPEWLLVTFVAGGLLGLVIVTRARIGLARFLALFGLNEMESLNGCKVIPYGVAIAIGAVVTAGPGLLGFTR